MTIRFRRYELQPAPDPAFAAAAPREGALLEITGDEGARGYADLHPWPELGHAPLAGHLASLATGQPTTLATLAVRHARTDAAGRRAGVSLFDGLPAVRSHGLMTSWTEAPRSTFEQCAERGCGTIKLKIGRNPVREASALNAVGDLPFRWRLDANARLSADSVREFLSALSGDVRARIEFLEDPCPYEPDVWATLGRTTGIPLALDWELPERPPPWPGACLLVIKPAVQDAFPLARAAAECGMDLVVTHSMDHPLGRATALWTAMRLRQRHGAIVREGGLDGSGLYAREAFAPAWNEASPQAGLPRGTGFGFDRLLQELDWSPLQS